MNANHTETDVVSSAKVKRVWAAPQISAVRVTQTALGSGFYGEQIGQNGCVAYDSGASTNVCVVGPT